MDKPDSSPADSFDSELDAEFFAMDLVRSGASNVAVRKEADDQGAPKWVVTSEGE